MNLNGASPVMVGRSPAIERLRREIQKIAAMSLPVLIEGPTGVGKELVAQALHRESRRRGELIAVNVCAIADGLFEDNLFGHVRGAFTGALRDHDGHLLEAHEGTLFLDEIGSLAPAPQAKLLRVVETRRFRPLGAARDRVSDFRLVAATNQPLAQLVRSGDFREDLAHRISGLTLRVPALKDRLEDVPLLAEHFAASFTAAARRAVQFSDAAMEVLRSYEWPGNVRELRSVIEVTIAMSEHSVISQRDVEATLYERRRVAHDDIARAAARRELVDVLERAGGDTRAAAEELGVDRGTVYRRLKEHGIPTPRQRRGDSGDELLNRLG